MACCVLDVLSASPSMTLVSSISHLSVSVFHFPSSIFRLLSLTLHISPFIFRLWSVTFHISPFILHLSYFTFVFRLFSVVRLSSGGR